MKAVALSLALVVFTLTLWGLFIWLFGELGLIGVIITGFALPLWGGAMIAWLMAELGIEDD